MFENGLFQVNIDIQSGVFLSIGKNCIRKLTYVVIINSKKLDRIYRRYLLQWKEQIIEN